MLHTHAGRYSIFLKNWGRAGRAVGGGGETDWHPPPKKTLKKPTTNNIVNLQNSNPRLNSPWCEKKWRRGLFLDARKICPLFRKLLLALLDCDRYRSIQVFSDESCADPDNFFPGGFRDIFLEFWLNNKIVDVPSKQNCGVQTKQNRVPTKQNWANKK